MGEEKIGAVELLAMAVDMLEEISVPMRYALQIARPMSAAIENIRQVIDAMSEENPEGGEENV